MFKIIQRGTGKLPTFMNFGCGGDIKMDVMNVDALCNYDIPVGAWVAESEMLNPVGVPQNHFTKIDATMVFEHIHPDLIPSTLYTMRCALRENGEIHAVVPDFAEIAAAITRSSPYKSLTERRDYRRAACHLMDPQLTLSTESLPFWGHKSVWTEGFAFQMFTGEQLIVKSIDKKDMNLYIIATK